MKLFYHLSMTEDRLGKFLAHYEAYKIATKIPGEIVECGIFKGTSFVGICFIKRIIWWRK